MYRTQRLLATLAVILIAGIATVKGVTDERSVVPAGTISAAESVPGTVSQRPTALVVLCFPGGGCIVCHNGYCEYTKRM
jgi:hypothetical protein